MRFFGRLRLTYPTHVACTCRVRLSALCRSFSLSRSVPRFFRCPFAPLYPGGFNVHESFATFDGIRATRRRPGTMTSRPAGAWKITFPLYHYADFFCHFVIPPTTLSRRHMAKRREVDERARAPRIRRIPWTRITRVYPITNKAANTNIVSLLAFLHC